MKIILCNIIYTLFILCDLLNNFTKLRMIVNVGNILYNLICIRNKNLWRSSMKSKKNNDKFVWGLILGFVGGLLLDNIALGLVIGVVIGSLTKFS